MKYRQSPHKGEALPSSEASLLREFILGGQDGLVNVMGIVLGVAIATNDVHTVLIAGLVATFAESISMAAVAYTSTQAERSFYKSMVEKEEWEMKNLPKREEQEIYDIYYNWGFRGKLLKDVVKKIISDNRVWLEVMMTQELKLESEEKLTPLKAGIIVGLAAFAGSLIPIIPFVLIKSVSLAMWSSLFLGVLILFFAGAYKAKVTTGVWWRSGLEIAVIGTTAAIAGYLVGAWLGASPG